MKTSVIIESLELDCVVGVYDFEREFEQRLLADLELVYDFSAALTSDNIDDTLDYAAVADYCRTVAREGQYQLLERLVGELADGLQEKFGISAVRLELRKPGAVAGTGSVGVIVDTR